MEIVYNFIKKNPFKKYLEHKNNKPWNFYVKNNFKTELDQKKFTKKLKSHSIL